MATTFFSAFLIDLWRFFSDKMSVKLRAMNNFESFVFFLSFPKKNPTEKTSNTFKMCRLRELIKRVAEKIGDRRKVFQNQLMKFIRFFRDDCAESEENSRLCPRRLPTFYSPASCLAELFKFLLFVKAT